MHDKTAAGLSRRTFTIGTSATTLVGLMAPLGAVSAAMAKPGGTARIGLNGASSNDSLDPGKMITGYTYVSSRALRNNLTEISATGELVPELAESWDPSTDLMTWTFRIRKGVEFHSGKPLTAHDVASSINFHRGPNTRSSAKSYLASINEIITDGTSTVVVRLNSPNADIPYIMSDVRLPILPSGGNDSLDTSGVGTGAYMLDAFEPGVRLTAKRNPNYWKPDSAYFDAIELIAINDGTARASAIRSGAIDIMNKCDTKTVTLLARDRNLRVLEQPTAQHCTAPMVVTMAPFDNPDVRLAMKYAINRQSIVDATLFGHGTIGNDQPIGPTYKYFAKDIPQREYDPDRAKFHLKKAGLDTLQVTLRTATLDFPGANDAAVLMKEHARRAGIDIDVREEPNDGYYANVWKKVPWCMSASQGRPIESLQFATAYATGANSNETLWSNDRFMSLFKEALSTLDEAKRRDIYREMQMLVRDDSGQIIYAFSHSLDVHSVKIGHKDTVSNSGELDGYRVAERWWFV